MPINIQSDLLSYYNANKGSITKIIANEVHYAEDGSHIRNYTSEWNTANRYGDTVNMLSEKPNSFIYDLQSSRLTGIYSKFNLQTDSSQTSMLYTVREPYILRGIQRPAKKHKTKVQKWGTEELGDNPILGGLAERVDRTIFDIARLAKSIVSPRGIAFVGAQLLFKLYTSSEYSFISTKIPVMARLIKAFSGKPNVKNIAAILSKTREDGNYAGKLDLVNTFGLGTYSAGNYDKYNSADDKLFTPQAKRAMIPISFENIDGSDRLEFRGINLSGLTNSFNAGWDSKTYIGRPDPFHTYKSFSRAPITIGFDVFAISYLGLKGMYQKLNVLSGMTAPIFNNNYRMISPLARLSVGNYIQDEEGYIVSVSITPYLDLPWELGLSDKNGKSLTLREKAGLAGAIAKIKDKFKSKDKKMKGATAEEPILDGVTLPRAFKVEVSYQTIENELPTQLGTKRLNDRTRTYFGPNEWLADIPKE